ncbi:hypothetical protein [Aminiphilus circumscriptus]|uniref:hypothetical protein n=1 Tax=Aminiphilus circumscriptus TaxID=290732 RepID=UPI0004BCAC63|nr:hypothetical protein [Aminiphilus circumscriptus]
MGWAGGGESQRWERPQRLWETRMHVAAEGVFRGASVEIDDADLRMGVPGQ